MTQMLDRPTPPSIDLHARGALHLVETESLWGAAMDVLRRPHLDVDLQKLVAAVDDRHAAHTVTSAWAFVPRRMRTAGLLSAVYDEVLVEDLRSAGMGVDIVSWGLSPVVVGHHCDPLSGIETPIVGHVNVVYAANAMSERASEWIRTGKIGTVIIYSDDATLEPLVKDLGHFGTAAHVNLTIVHAHIDPATKTFDGTQDVLVDRGLYESCLGTSDRLARAQAQTEKILGKDSTELVAQIQAEHPALVDVELHPDFIRGLFRGKSEYHDAFEVEADPLDSEPHKLAVVRSLNFYFSDGKPYTIAKTKDGYSISPMGPEYYNPELEFDEFRLLMGGDD